MSGIVLTEVADATIPTPASGKVTVYFSTEEAGPAFKDDAAAVSSLVGATGGTGATGAGYGGTSTTSLAIATGSKAFTTQAGLAYVVGSRVRAASAADPADYMEGVVTAYSGTGLTILVDLIGGTGTDADWSFSIAGDPGVGTVALTGDTGSATGIDDITFVGATVTDDTGGAATITITAGGGLLRYAASLPSGTLEREYTFDSTVESWTTSAGTLSSTSSRLQLTHTSPAVAEEPSGASDVADGELELEFRTTSMTGSAAVLFRLDDASNFYALIFQPEAAFTLYKFVAGSPTQLNTFGNNAASAWGPVQLLIRFVATQIEVYLNGLLILLTRDATFSTGRVGIRADNATMQVDNVRVYSSPVMTGNVRVEGL
jgi:hypothetical protein